jgi:hypothetical protein
LALDLLDPAELVDHRVGHPALPQRSDDLRRPLPQGGPAFRGLLEPSAFEPGQAAGLDQQWPRE